MGSLCALGVPMRRGPPRKGDWPSENEVNLRIWWDEGMIASEIGRRLGLSKNSVIGKVHRLGLPGRRPSPIRNNGIYRTSRKTPKPILPIGKKPTLPPMPSIVHVVAIVPEIPEPLPKVQPMPRPSELKCQYTESDGRPWVFCNAPTHWFMRMGQLIQSSYCCEHHQLCWRKSERQRQMENA
jgi:hypothetical protein